MHIHWLLNYAKELLLILLSMIIALWLCKKTYFLEMHAEV